MLKKTINYTDFNDVNQSEDLYFNLTKTELTEMQIDSNGTLSDSIQAIVESKDGKAILNEFKRIIRSAYGVKSEDGKRFIKSEQLSDEFLQTAAYDVLFLELVTDADAAVTFLKGLVPADLAANMAASVEAAEKQRVEVPTEALTTQLPLKDPYPQGADTQTPYGVPTQTQQL